jgi:anti-anti-sigma regulatory factor
VATTIPTRVRLTEDDKRVLRAYWEFFEPIADQINDELRESLMQLPEWAAIIRSIPQQQQDEQNKASRSKQRTACIDGDWAPYLDELRQQGLNYARMGISFVAWYDIIAIYRELIRRRLVALAQQDIAKATGVGDGMNRMLDIAMSHLGEAYLAAKEAIIKQQQDAIRELSLPVLQVRDRLLVIPLVGMMDSTRARQLIETMLTSIRDRRARGVVVDVTGVPIVDTAIANHLVQACDAARLMGAQVVITGISPEMAQTLVGLGARLPANDTLVDLQEGITFLETTLAMLDSGDALQVADQVS